MYKSRNFSYSVLRSYFLIKKHATLTVMSGILGNFNNIINDLQKVFAIRRNSRIYVKF